VIPEKGGGEALVLHAAVRESEGRLVGTLDVRDAGEVSNDGGFSLRNSIA